MKNVWHKVLAVLLTVSFVTFALFFNYEKTLAAISVNDITDNSAAPGSTTLSWQFTNHGNIFILGALFNTNTVTGSATYGGQSMTATSNSPTDIDSANRLYVWYLSNPPTGNNTVTVTTSGGALYRVRGVTLAGAALSGQPDSVGNVTVASGVGATTTVTTVNDKAWLVGICRETINGNTSAGYLTSLLDAGESSTVGLYQSSINPISPAGAATLNCTTSPSNAAIGIIGIAVIPTLNTHAAIYALKAKVFILKSKVYVQ